MAFFSPFSWISCHLSRFPFFFNHVVEQICIGSLVCDPNVFQPKKHGSKQKVQHQIMNDNFSYLLGRFEFNCHLKQKMSMGYIID